MSEPVASVVRMVPSKAAVEFSLRFFMDAEIMGSFPVEDRSIYAAFDAAKGVENGSVLAYAILLSDDNGGERPVGIFWGTMVTRHTILGHWGILKEYRRRGVAEKAMESLVSVLQKDLPAITSIMGLVAVNNRKCLAQAMRGGFQVQGNIPKSHNTGEELIDSLVLIKELESTQ